MKLIINFLFALTCISISTDAANFEQDRKKPEYEIYLFDKNFTEPRYSGNDSDSLIYQVTTDGHSSGTSNQIEEGEKATPGIRQYTKGNIVAGGGYSTDTQQIVPQICYNATVSSTSEQQAYIQLDTAITSSELESKLGTSVSVSGRYEMFSTEAKATYMRSIQDKDYATSLNYYEYATNNVAVQLSGYGTKALTESGRDFYNDGKNSYFGLLCGDHYIASYQQGALLTMGLNIKFSSSKAKEDFDAKISAKFGNIVSAAGSIETIATRYNITGSVIIQAFQIGGEPSQLSKILNKDSDGMYYALTCSLTAMTNCIKAATGLLDYAKDEFSTQFSFQNNTGLTPLGMAFSQYNPIEYIGLISPATLVTPEVSKLRTELSDKLKENEYYQEKIYPFFNEGYPGELVADFLTEANSILSRSIKNVHILMQAHEGAIDCFNFPDRCKTIKAVIDSKLENITTSDLQFLEKIKYKITIFGGLLYNKGVDFNSYSWNVVPYNKPGKESVAKVYRLWVSKNFLDYHTDNHIPVTSRLYEVKYNGNLSSDGRAAYIGTMCSRASGSNWNPCQSGYVERILLSEFFFEVYNSTK